MSRDGSESTRGFTFISWKKSTVPKSAEERGPPLCPDWDRARSAMMSRRTKRARSCSSCIFISRRGMRILSKESRSKPNPATLPDGASRPQPDSRSRVVVPSLAGIGDHPGAHGARDLLDPVADAPRGAEPPFPLDPVEADPVGPRILFLGLDRDAHPRHVRLELLLQIPELIVLEVVAEVQDGRALRWKRLIERQDDPPRDVRDVDEGAPLRSAENRDRTFADGLLREEIDREVEAHPGREPVDGAETENHRLEAGVPGNLENPLLGVPAGLGIEGERLRRRFLVQSLLPAFAVDAARRREYEPAHPGRARPPRERDGGAPVRLDRELLVLRARLVPNDRREMDDGVHTLERLFVHPWISKVPHQHA